MNDRIVLIVGAGPTGLVLALWLTKLGVRVRIIDKAPEAGTTSRAVTGQARTLELRQVGPADAVVEAGVRVRGVNLWVGGANVGGQGTNTGIGDAVKLAWKLAAAYRMAATRVSSRLTNQSA